VAYAFEFLHFKAIALDSILRRLATHQMMPNRDLSVLANEELYSCGVQGLVEVEVSRSTLTLTHSISMSTKFIITQREHAFLCI
jgi:hypothetical protein